MASNVEEEASGLSMSGMIKEIQGLKDKFKNEDEEARKFSYSDGGLLLPS